MAESSRQKFAFVNLSHPDDLKDQATIDHIRCAAMSSFGRQRRMKKSKREKNQIVFELRQAEPTVTNPQTMSRVGLETLDPFYSLPINLDASMSKLCTNIFGTNCGHSIELRSAWSAVGFYDDLSFQTVLFNSALYGQMVQTGKLVSGDTTESLQLHSKALQMINYRLDDPHQQTSDSVVGSMSGFLTHDYVIGDFDGWNKHMEGLLKMVKLRGGFQTLTSEMLHITLTWTDICGSFSQDISPRFPLPPTWLNSLPPQMGGKSILPSRPMTSPIATTWMQELPECLNWITIFDSLIALTADRERPWNTWFEAILHRLLRLRPLQSSETPTPEAIIEEVARIGTLLAIAPIWRTFGIHPVRTKALRLKLLAILKKYFAEWGRLRHLFLWVLMHATREADSPEEVSQFGTRMVMVMGKMNIKNWNELVEVISQVVPCEDKPGQGGLWAVVRGMVERSFGSGMTTPVMMPGFEAGHATPAAPLNHSFAQTPTEEVLFDLEVGSNSYGPHK